ncbi:unnamed protein product, partial [Rotaria magnacalcarata]
MATSFDAIGSYFYGTDVYDTAQKKGISDNSSLVEWFYSFKRRWNHEIKLVEASNLESIRSFSCTQIAV